MPQNLKIKLDVTTFYSSLGLTSNATEIEIQKSYRKLARELHPDKSKSDSAAELFKVINNAYSVLLDKEKKNKYDHTLLAKGLTNYKPKDSCHIHKGSSETTNDNFQKHIGETKTPQKNTSSQNNHYKPYGQQPYGFGTGGDNNTNVPSHSKVPIFQSFNLKNYQRSQTSPHKNDRKFQSKGTSDLDDEKNQTPPPRHGSKEVYEKRNGDKRDEGIELNDEIGIGVRSKLHKSNSSDPFENLSGSPFASNGHRHYARTKHEARTQERRSVSPVKTAPNSGNADMSESWDSLKNILNNFREGDRSFKTKKNEIEVIKNRSSKGAKVRKAESQSITLNDLSNSLPIDDDFFDMRKVSDTLNTVPVVKKTKLSPREEGSEIEMESPEQKLMNDRLSHHRDPTTDTFPTNLEGNLYMPVNQPLPKIYKPELIPLHQYKIDSKVMELKLPSIPDLQCNILNKSEVEKCKENVKDFNTQSNVLKQKLLSTLSERLEADRILNEKLVKVENTANWASCKDFDFEIVSKLTELNNRQRIVAQSFANILKTMYAVGHE